MVPIVIGVAGGIGSGKTEFARLLAEHLVGRLVSFGDFVRTKAAERGLESSREVLQALGECLISEFGWDEFVSAVIAPWDRRGHLVVDGVRHVEAARALRRSVAPTAFRLVYLDANIEMRKVRLSQRHSDAQNLSALDTHSTERDVHSSLRSVADLVLDATSNAEALADAAIRSFAAGDLNT